MPATPLLSARFLRDNPAATVRIDATSSREIARRLADFEIDAGLTYLDDETPPGADGSNSIVNATSFWRQRLTH